MEEKPYIPEETKELLKDGKEIVLHGLDGKHYNIPKNSNVPIRSGFGNGTTLSKAAKRRKMVRK